MSSEDWDRIDKVKNEIFATLTKSVETFTDQNS